jgi:hypothetical protein
MRRPTLSPAASKNGLSNRIPIFEREPSSSQPLGELAQETIITTVSKYPATALAGGFILGGLLGWLLARAR